MGRRPLHSVPLIFVDCCSLLLFVSQRCTGVGQVAPPEEKDRQTFDWMALYASNEGAESFAKVSSNHVCID